MTRVGLNMGYLFPTDAKGLKFEKQTFLLSYKRAMRDKVVDMASKILGK